MTVPDMAPMQEAPRTTEPASKIQDGGGFNDFSGPRVLGHQGRKQGQSKEHNFLSRALSSKN
jgi:hypothetical protein